MNISRGDRYKTGFRIASVIVPLLMAAAGYFYGDLEPIARDICGVVLPKGALNPPARPSDTTLGDAGAPR